MIDHLTITMPYYEAPEMLKTHLENWCSYPDDLADKVDIVLIDDGSPKYPAAEVLKASKLPRSPIKLFRVLENIPWNHGGARNLGMHCVSEGWVLSTDIDHVLTVDNLERLMSLPLDPFKSYRPGRVQENENGTECIKPHRETFIMTREMFWKIGGFDEDFNGYWNGVFYPFLKNVRRICSVIALNEVNLLWKCDFKDATVQEWGRIGSKWDINVNLEMRSKQHKAARNYQPTNPLRFNWEQVR